MSDHIIHASPVVNFWYWLNHLVRGANVTPELQLGQVDNLTYGQCVGSPKSHRCTAKAINFCGITPTFMTKLYQDCYLECAGMKFLLQVWHKIVPTKCKARVLPLLYQIIFFDTYDLRPQVSMAFIPGFLDSIASEPDMLSCLELPTSNCYIPPQSVIDLVVQTIFHRIRLGRVSSYSISFTPVLGGSMIIDSIMVHQTIFSAIKETLITPCEVTCNHCTKGFLNFYAIAEAHVQSPTHHIEVDLARTFTLQQIQAMVVYTGTQKPRKSRKIKLQAGQLGHESNPVVIQDSDDEQEEQNSHVPVQVSEAIN